MLQDSCLCFFVQQQLAFTLIEKYYLSLLLASSKKGLDFAMILMRGRVRRLRHELAIYVSVSLRNKKYIFLHLKYSSKLRCLWSDMPLCLRNGVCSIVGWVLFSVCFWINAAMYRTQRAVFLFILISFFDRLMLSLNLVLKKLQILFFCWYFWGLN